MGNETPKITTQAAGTERLLRDIVEGIHKVQLLRPVYPTLLAFHVTKDLNRLTTHATAGGARVVVTFEPRQAGEHNETNNEVQRYEILVNPLPKEGEVS